MNEETMMTKVLLKYPKSELEEVQVAVREYKGKKYMDFRVYFRKDEHQIEYFPTKKGFTLPVEKGEELIRVLATMNRGIR